MDFEEYVSANYKRLEGQTREFVEDAFETGQQSKQEEVNKLQAQLDKLQKEVEELKFKIQSVLNTTCRLQYSRGERVYEEIKELLK